MKLLISVLLALTVTLPALAAPIRPNILWISAEDLSPDLGSYGDIYARTPNLDKLASQGARFAAAFSVAPVCAPSRSAIITGMYPTSIGSHHMRSKAVPPAGVKAFPEYLRAAGYYCTNNSKTDYNFEAPPSHTPPVTVWDESSRNAHWRNRTPGQPFFAVFNLTATHESQIRTGSEEFAKNTEALRPEDRHDPSKAVLPPYYPDTPIVRNDWARYHDLITAMDLQAAALLKQLEEDGLAANTIVFFWGDHGRGLPRAKRWVYDSGIRVPLIVRWPGKIQPGTARDDLVSLLDLAPTVLTLAGVPVPSHMQGQAFLGENAPPPRRYVFAHRDRMDETYDMMRAVHDGRYKYIRNFFPGRPYAQYIGYMEEMPTMREMRRVNKEHFNATSTNYGKAMTPAQAIFFLPEKPEEELYDITADPHELSNLAKSPAHQSVIQHLRQALEQWQKETKDLGLIPEAELRERMRPGGVWARTLEPKMTERAAKGPAAVALSLACETPGASIAYTTEEGDNARWKLYSQEITLKRPVTLRVKACRLGFNDSAEVVRRFE
ncbi:MAG: sulfatase-like hydrolase/transferase [Acidobacteria bacterium]|nr:sulfatase-like hydrolase/transferase [Acidobacteriota bacterium]MCI0623032.1 sulfatase-like hydrolase/transferase [Acidobacteriota bacterium]MCI0720639.1 sulfatase-like hydrolase/transferase [Acidobacteriota bacterium]